MASRNWSRIEVEATVADYFAMLDLELRGQPFNKTEHRRALLQLLDDRSEGAVELKHQNISAILIELGFPYIDGYKPRGNYQALLREVIESRLEADRGIQETVLREVVSPQPEVPSVDDFLAALVDPPSSADRVVWPGSVRESSGPPRRPNYLRREALNSSLGQAGEIFALNFERARLAHAGRASLGDRVEHVADTEGDHLGYDIRSFEVDGSDRFIEVKTTRYGRDTPFFVSRNQVSVSASLDRSYHLYRLFRFKTEPRLFTVAGSLAEVATLEPVEYSARVR